MTDVGLKEEGSSDRTGIKSDGVSGKLAMFSSPPVFGIVLFLFVTTFPPFEVATEINLGIHMLQHVIIAVAGVLIGYSLFKSGKVKQFINPRFAILGVFVIASLLIFWHLPTFWDSAVESVYVHIIEHFSFLLVGSLIGFCVPQLQDNLKMILLALTISAHMFFGFALYIIGTRVYPLYPVSQQQLLGVALFAPAPVYFIGYLYLNLTRENRRLEALELGASAVKIPKRSIRKAILPMLTILMIGALVAYFAITGFVIVSANTPQGAHASVIFIQESPITWQFSPQVIHVVIGVNNTVEWESHSFTYDTVTSSTGIFSSGSLGPGDTYSHTFTQVGTFDYFCQYHLWMHGTIIVENP